MVTRLLLPWVHRLGKPQRSVFSSLQSLQSALESQRSAWSQGWGLGPDSRVGRGVGGEAGLTHMKAVDVRAEGCSEALRCSPCSWRKGEPRGWLLWGTCHPDRAMKVTLGGPRTPRSSTDTSSCSWGLPWRRSDFIRVSSRLKLVTRTLSPEILWDRLSCCSHHCFCPWKIKTELLSNGPKAAAPTSFMLSEWAPARVLWLFWTTQIFCPLTQGWLRPCLDNPCTARVKASFPPEQGFSPSPRVIIGNRAVWGLCCQ